MCGKYTELIDSYKSVMEAFVHAGVENNARVNIKWIQTEKIKNYKDVRDVFLMLMVYLYCLVLDLVVLREK